MSFIKCSGSFQMHGYQHTRRIYFVHSVLKIQLHSTIRLVQFTFFRKFNPFEMDSSAVIHFQIESFRFFGLLPKEDSLFVLKLWGWIVWGWSGFILVCCQAISVFYVKTTNEMVEELLLLCCTTTIGIKLAFFYLNRKSVPNILNILIKLNVRVYNEGSVRTVETVHTRCRQVSRIYYVLYIGSLVVLAIQLIFLDRSERTWKSTALVPTEFAQQPSVYYGVLIAETIGNALNCILAATIDTYCFLLISLLAGHIEAFSLQLSEYGISKAVKESNPKKLRLLKYLEHFNLLDE